MSGEVTVITAFIAGIVSFLSPCVLPIIPGYISLITGITTKELTEVTEKKGITKIVIFNSIFFITGFTAVFILLQVVLRGFVSFFNKQILNYIFGIIIIIFGLHIMGLIRIKLLYYQKSFQVSKHRVGIIGSLIIGIVFGFAWMPCIGPILASILALATQEKTLFKGILLLLVYSAGLGVPFLLAGIFLERFLSFVAKFRKMLRITEIIAGVLLIFIGILIITDRFATFFL